MATLVVMPKFGLSMEEGVIGSWLVSEGSPVKKGDALVEVETDKIVNTIESTEDGVLRKVIAHEGDTIPCGAAVCIIASENEDISELMGDKISSNIKKESPTSANTNTAAIKISSTEIKITPRAKKIADDKGIDYLKISGTGIHGAITIDDLKKFMIQTQDTPQKETVIEQVQAQKAAASIGFNDFIAQDNGVNGQIIKMTPMQNTIAKKMFESISTQAQVTISAEAEVTPLTKLYKELKSKYKAAGIKLSYTAMIVKAAAQALENHPKMRSFIVDAHHYKLTDEVNIGLAIDTPTGLVVPVIHNANLKDLRTICLEIEDLAKKAVENKLTIEDMSGGTFTITNLGMFNISTFTPIINAPESAILGVGMIKQQIVVKNDTFSIGSMMNLSLTHDHRIIDGAPAARFLMEITSNLSDFRWL